MRVANEAGWFLLNSVAFEAIWDGGPGPESTVVRPCPGDDSGPPGAASHFGLGIVTWYVPYLFRTSPGWNLLVRGPTNSPRDGACALDAIVESDWSVASFTMNWRLLRPGEAVRFGAGEPFCMILPVPRLNPAEIKTSIRWLHDYPDLNRRHREWAESRNFTNRALAQSKRPLWQKDYYLGRDRSGADFDGHQVRLRLPPFRDLRRARLPAK